jgi:DDE superfamily endonuclease
MVDFCIFIFYKCLILLMKNPAILDLYSDFLLSSFSLVTATGLAQLIDNGYSHDQISRFLSQGKFDNKDFWKCVKNLIRQVETATSCLIIDDTLEEKPYSTENDIICWHFDHCTNQMVKGINIVNFLYSSDKLPNESINLPCAFEVVSKTEEYFDKKTQKIKRRSPITKNEIVLDRLRTLVQMNRLTFKYVLWDTWFSSKENLAFVHDDLKKLFVVALKSNRTVALSEADKRQGKFKKVEELDFQNNQTYEVWLKGLDFPVLAVKQVFINKGGSTGDMYLITNDLELSFHDICTIYQKRWNVENFHKSLKQNAALEKSPTKYEVTQSNHIFASMIAYCKLEILKVKKNINHFQLKKRLYMQALKAAFNELQNLKNEVKELKDGQSSLVLKAA